MAQLDEVLSSLPPARLGLAAASWPADLLPLVGWSGPVRYPDRPQALEPRTKRRPAGYGPRGASVSETGLTCGRMMRDISVMLAATGPGRGYRAAIARLARIVPGASPGSWPVKAAAKALPAGLRQSPVLAGPARLRRGPHAEIREDVIRASAGAAGRLRGQARESPPTSWAGARQHTRREGRR